jgi:ankyrin repeat protein
VCSRSEACVVVLCPQSGYTPLHKAAINGRDEEMKKLIAEGGDPEAVDKVRCVLASILFDVISSDASRCGYYFRCLQKVLCVP